MKQTHDIYLETGKKKVFAGAIDWPGWCRPGRDEASAIQALFQAGSRYAKVMQRAQLEFVPPREHSELRIVERLEGNTTTDFGAPDRAVASDAKPIAPDDLHRLEKILKGTWLYFDQVTAQARGKSLRLGPRGGGRDLQKIIEHVVEAEKSYLRALGWSARISEGGNLEEGIGHLRNEIINGLEMATKGSIPEKGPRGGKRWLPRYFVRRVAWHVLDHAWEIEDRIS